MTGRRTGVERTTVGVVGLGLIGGSIARAWVEEAGGEAVAWTRSADTRARAAEQGIGVAASISEVVERADVVFLCTPLPVLADSMAEVASALAGRSGPPTITDVGSVKAPIHDLACRVLPDPSIFVPGHPMAGTERAGWASADPDLFRAANWALVVDEPVAMAHWLAVLDVALAIGAAVVPVGASEHDQAVALTSHLPHLLAAGLRSLLDAEPSPLAAALVGGSFRSATRVTEGSGRDLGAEMAWANRAAAVDRIDQVIVELRRQREALLGQGPGAIAALFPDAASDAEAPAAKLVTVSPDRHELLALGRRGGLVVGVDEATRALDAVEPISAAVALADETRP